MWRSLEEAFSQDTKYHERSLITNLYTCKKDSSSILQYIIRFRGIYDELAVIFGDDKFSWMAIGLVSKYMSLWIHNSQNRFFLPSLIFSALNNHELRISSHEGENSIGHNLAFIGLKEGGWGRGCDHGRGGGTRTSNFNSQGCGFVPSSQSYGNANNFNSTQSSQNIGKKESFHMVWKPKFSYYKHLKFFKRQ